MNNIDPRAELLRLHQELTELADWAELRLDDENCGRQYIAEHLLNTLTALLSGQPAPRTPF